MRSVISHGHDPHGTGDGVAADQRDGPASASASGWVIACVVAEGIGMTASAVAGPRI